MFELVFLGTSASAPSVHRGLSSAMVLHKEYRFMVDCGEGTQRQLLRSGLGFRRLDRILLTHGHLDHILGLGGIASTFGRWEAIDRLEIWGGRWALDRVERLMEVVFGTQRPLEIEFYDIESGVLLEDDSFVLSAFPVVHRGPGCFGFLFEEKSRRPFLADKADELGVPKGPERGCLVRGTSISLADGRQVHPDQVLGPVQPGARLAFVGDAAHTRNLHETVRGVDALVIEGTYVQRDEDLARQFGHLTAAQAARFAREAGVRALILTHLSRRYAEREVMQEAAEIFPGVYVARDFDMFQVAKGGEVKMARPGQPDR
jgi:ribonuclease Z